jgi:hypothetical protein
VIVELRWFVPAYHAIVTIEVSAASLAEAGQKAARVIRELAVPSERTVPLYPQEPTVRRARP